MTMNDQLQDYIEKYQSMTTRERLLIAGVCLIVVFFVVDYLALQPALSERTRLQQDIASAQRQRADQGNEIANLSSQLANSPTIVLQRQIESLKNQLREQDESVQARASGLTPAMELPVLLKEILEQHPGLTFEKLETLPVEELKLLIAANGSPGDNADEKNTSTGVFKHTVELSLKGSYLALFNYLQSIEQMPWQLYWQELDYNSDQYPNASIRIQVYTLSTAGGAFAE